MAAVDQFIASRRPRWDALAQLLQRAGTAPRRLEAADLERLGQLYRSTTADLALARRDFPDDQVVLYLNDLAGRAHPLVYRASAGAWVRVRDFWLIGYPAVLRASGWYVVIAFLLFSLPAMLSFAVANLDPTGAEAVLPPVVTADVRSGRLWTEIPPRVRPLASSFIMTNNIKVAISAFAGGVLLGMLTLYVLVYNGIHFGSVLGYVWAFGLGPDLLAFVSPHGVIELSVIFFSGGAGLQLGLALLRPGLLSRRDALVQAAQRAVLLLLGSVPLLVLAGLIEGFVSPSGLPRELKWTLGPLSGVLLYWYLLRRPRLESAPRFQLEVGGYQVGRQPVGRPI
jgi:uncharacterized membrane protein SpoIIM required for sporulation